MVRRPVSGRPLRTVGTPSASSCCGKLTTAVQRHQEYAVDVTARGVLDESAVVIWSGGHGEHQLEPGRGDRHLGAAEHPEEERVGEHPLLGLVDEECHRVAAPGDE